MSMTLERVVAEVVEEAIVEFSRSLDEALNDALNRLSQYKQEVLNEAKQELEAAKRAAEAHRMRLVSQAELEAKRLYLTAIDEAVNKVLEHAVEILKARKKTKQYEEALERLLQEAFNTVGGTSFKIWCSGEDSKVVRDVAKRTAARLGVKASVMDERIDCIGGVRVSNEDGSVVFDNTFDARLARMKQAIRSEILAMLTS